MKYKEKKWKKKKAKVDDNLSKIKFIKKLMMIMILMKKKSDII